MDVPGPDELWLFLFFVLPGLIGVHAWDLLVPGPERNAPEQILRGVTFSVLNVLLVWPAVTALGPVAAPWVIHLGAVLVLVVLPVLEAVALRAVLRWRWLRKAAGLQHPVPTPWDYFFGRGTTCWLILHLKSGRRIAGYYGMHSFASSFPNPEQVYLEAVWDLSEGNERRFHRRAPRTHGTIVSMSECESIEMFTDEPEAK